MPNVYAATWTMSEGAFGGRDAGQRATELTNIALAADTLMKIEGRVHGGAFTRMLIIPEYVFNAGAGGGIMSRDDKHAMYRQLIGISAAVPELLIIAGTISYQKTTFWTRTAHTYNVCPILLGGQIVKKLYKADDDGVYAANGTFRTKTDGNKGVPYVNVAGLTIGVDICMDLNQGDWGRLGHYIRQNNLAAPDFHIQISGTNAASTPRAAARVGGVYLHCDLGAKGMNGATAWRVTAQDAANGATVTRIQPDQVTPQQSGRMMLFTVPV